MGVGGGTNCLATQTVGRLLSCPTVFLLCAPLNAGLTLPGRTSARAYRRETSRHPYGAVTGGELLAIAAGSQCGGGAMNRGP